MTRAAVYLVFLAVAVAFGDGRADAQAIPPGQEELLSAMLGKGAQLPGGCSLGDGQVAHDVVQTTYHCPDGDVVIRLSHPNARSAKAVVTDQFALTVVQGSAPAELLSAIESHIRAKEADFEWNAMVPSMDGRPSATFVLLLLALAIPASISAWRSWTTRPPMARGPVLEALVVAGIVTIWLQAGAQPPAHTDTSVDVALARDCIASNGVTCLGHVASAMNLLQGQAFTYAIALWLLLDFSMRQLCIAVACIHGVATGALHHATACRFGAAAWVASAFAPTLGVYLSAYPNMVNPSWFVLPLTIAFLCTLAIARGCGVWSAFGAGVALAMSSEAHILFGPFVGVAAVIALITAPRPLVAATVVLASFACTEMVISPSSTPINVLILRQWVGAHAVHAAVAALLLAASAPILSWLRRAIRDSAATREIVAVLVWLVAGIVGFGVVLPWAVSNPLQARYFGLAFPAVVYAGAWFLDIVTLRARSMPIRAVAILAFAAIVTHRVTITDFAGSGFFMDDGPAVATTAGLADTSALDIQLMLRTLPAGSLGEAAAAFVGTPEVPVFPPRIVRAVRVRPDIDLPDGWHRITLARGDIATSDIDGWCRPEEAEVCPDPPSGASCVTLTRDDFRNIARDAGPYVHRVFGLRIARTAAGIGQWRQQGTQSLLWRIPLRPAGPDDAREIVFSEGGERIVAVDGTRWTARSDQQALIARPPPGSAASVTVRTPIADKYEAGIPPVPFELRAVEVDALRPLLPPGNHG